jgi:nucleoside-diphosphate-sugar epimerase
MNLDQRNIWILGGTGYIGNALVRYLSRDPANSLHLLIHKRGDRRFLEAFNTFTGSLAEVQPRWFERYSPDVVFHLARPAGSSLLTRNLRSWQGAQANKRLIHILGSLKKPPVIVYVSGSLMYGKRELSDPAFEDSTLNPDAYAKYYIRNEQPWLDMQITGNLDVRFARPGWIVGPGSWFREFFWKPYQETGKVPCYGTHLMSLIHLEDCAMIIDALARYGNKGQDLNIFSGPAIPQPEFCKIIANILGTEINSIHFGEVKRRYGNTAAKALTSSIPMSTLYPNIHQKARIKFPAPDEIIQDVISKLQTEEAIQNKIRTVLS